MSTLHEISRLLHIIAGFAALGLFWLPILAKKGSRLHKNTGKYWLWLARLVFVTAVLGCVYAFYKFYSQGYTLNKDPNQYAFYLFLAYLAMVAFILTLYAVDVLRYKDKISEMSVFKTKVLPYFSILLSGLIIAFALIYDPKLKILLLILSPIGISAGVSMLKYMKQETINDKQWLIEHLSSMIRVGIAIHTAFAVFGAARFFNIGIMGGYWTLVTWMLPITIGLVSIEVFKRHYTKKYKINK